MHEIFNEEFFQEIRRTQVAAGRFASIAMCVVEDSTQSISVAGTVSFIKIPSGRFLLTSQKVWSKFEEHRLREPNCRLKIAGSEVSNLLDISDAEVISNDLDFGLCVMKFPSEAIQAIGKAYCKFLPWPPPRAEVGNLISFVGLLPERVKIDENPSLQLNSAKNYRQGLIRVSPVIESVFDSQINLDVEGQSSLCFDFPGRRIERSDWEGMSGSLVFKFDKHFDGWAPCALLQSVGDGPHSPVSAIHLDFLMDKRLRF